MPALPAKANAVELRRRRSRLAVRLVEEERSRYVI